MDPSLSSRTSLLPDAGSTWPRTKWCGGSRRYKNHGKLVENGVLGLIFLTSLLHLKDILLGTSISPVKGTFEDDFHFPWVGYVSSLERVHDYCLSNGEMLQ